MNNHRSYSDMNINKLLGKMKKPGLFFDGWNMFNPQEIQNISGYNICIFLISLILRYKLL